MPSSELSDALNPLHARQRNFTVSTSAYPTPALQPAPPPYIPHRSELELAISEPPPRPRPNTSPIATTSVHELVALIASAKQEQELERTRRLAWEQEQEAKYVQRQAEMERQLLDMRNEIALLRALISPSSAAPAIANLQHPRPASPVSPVSQPSSHSQQLFVQGSSRSSLNDALTAPRPVTPPSSFHDSETASSSARRSRRKRRRSVLSSEDDEGSGTASDTSSVSSRPRRTDHHDKRILTIQRAMREHILLSMDLANDKNLPDSHIEGQPLDSPSPVRFVWDKTTKQSAHNGRMKLRIIEDLRTRKRMYKHVPDKEFSKKVVDSAFEQSFTTFRQKFRTQRDAMAASRVKQREDAKARNARHLGRRKTKLSNRASARIKFDTFSHVTFEGAMQLECMSSEESDFDEASAYPRGSGPLQTRGYGWRSTRLLRFYGVLDNEDAVDANLRPARGVGRRGRFVGPLKDGFHMPPRGVASWMISRRWMSAMEAQYPDLRGVLGGVVVDVPGFDWGCFNELGTETEDEGYVQQAQAQAPAFPPQPQQQQQHIDHYSTSSLHRALA
ncbi:hypothetical protein R3P38DRAFT_2855776 [Favolaschia claudopus]|uniref:Uncharacterized protein n=1 Tax=Favolaschia claudopus TaxID=2862362 RepID=A0AAW0DTK5_9AGAR